jgi:hypothetical protein
METEYQVILVKQCVQHDKAKKTAQNNPKLIIDSPVVQKWITDNSNVVL